MTIPRSDAELRDWLSNAIYVATEEEARETAPRMESFAEAGMLAMNEDLVMRFATGQPGRWTCPRHTQPVPTAREWVVRHKS